MCVCVNTADTVVCALVFSLLSAAFSVLILYLFSVFFALLQGLFFPSPDLFSPTLH